MATAFSSQKQSKDHKNASVVNKSSKEILGWTILHRIATITLLLITVYLQRPFDTSADLLLRTDGAVTTASHRYWPATAFLRWDVIHFLGMASPRPLPIPGHGLATQLSNTYHDFSTGGGGLLHEHSFAFQPAIIWLLHLAGFSLDKASASGVSWNPAQALLVTAFVATIVSCFLPVLLYRLSFQVLRDDNVARLSAMLSILSTSPATLVSPTPESFFALFALLGHLAISSRPAGKTDLGRWAAAAICYGLATAFRANGLLLAGFLLWDILWEPNTSSSRPVRAALAFISSLVCWLPFVLLQVWTYQHFCSEGDPNDVRPWCKERWPNVYSYVQNHYWGVGFMSYWTLGQLPNWLLVAPIIGLMANWVAGIYRSDFHLVLFKTLPSGMIKVWDAPDRSHSLQAGRKDNLLRLQTAPGLLVHTHFTMVMLLVLVLFSHVQIGLRLATPGALPAVWWSAAQLVIASRDGGEVKEHDARRRLQNWLLPYLVLWNIASIILYAGFYPPA